MLGYVASEFSDSISVIEDDIGMSEAADTTTRNVRKLTLLLNLNTESSTKITYHSLI